MKIKLLAKAPTPADKSPAIYETDRGSYLIQGWKVNDEVRRMTDFFRADHEDVIEIPPELVHEIKNLI